MTGRLAVAIVAAAVILAAVPATVAAESWVTGEPELDLSASDNHFEASQNVSLAVDVANSGNIVQGGPARFEERVKTARNVRFRIMEDQLPAPIEVKTGTVLAGTIPEGSAGPYRFDLEIGDSIDPGTYRIPVEVTYDYTFGVEFSGESPQFVDSSRRRVEYVEVVIEEEADFDIVSESSERVVAGDTGRLSFTIKNSGSQIASDAVVRLTSQSPSVFFGDMRTPQRSKGVFVSRLAPGETYPVTVQVGATPEATPGSYPITAIVEYENPNGIDERSDALQLGQVVGAERTFELRHLRTEALRVDEDDAYVRGEIVNTGPLPANNAVVLLVTNGSIRATSPESAVGDLRPGRAKPVAFKVAVAEDAEPGTREFTFDVKYENAEGDLRRANDPIRRSFNVSEEIDEFEVVGVNTSLEAGSATTMRVRLRHTGEYPITDASAKLFVNDPLSTSDDESFLGNLDPGETATATFKVSAAGDALAKEYTGSVQVRYDDRTGDSELGDELGIGVPVRPASGGPPVLFIAAGVAVVVVAAGIFVWRRRR